MTSSPRLIFDHIPKTAGTSAAAALASAFHTEPVMRNQAHIRLPFDGPDQLLTGHLRFGYGEPLHDDWLYATVLRDPVERSLSRFFFNRRVADLPDAPADPDVDLCRGRSIEDLFEVASDAELSFLANVQAEHLADRLVPDPSSLDDDELFDAAVTELLDYDIVGVTERLGSFIDRCCERTGRVPPAAIGRLQSSPREPVPAQVTERLRRMTAVDGRLWEFARALPERRPPRARSGWTLGRPCEFGTRQVVVAAVQTEHSMSNGAPGVVITMDLEAREAVGDLNVGVEVFTDDVRVGTNTMLEGRSIRIEQPGRLRMTTEFSGAQPGQTYRIAAAAIRAELHTDGCYHWIDPVATFAVPDGLGPGATNPSIASPGLRLDGVEFLPRDK